MRVLSIDWDYFVKEDPMLDWGHKETELFLGPIWSTRRIRPNISADNKTMITEMVDLTKLAPFCGNEGFLTALAFRWLTYEIAVAESHLGILQCLENEENIEIINVDAHHDISYDDPPTTKIQVDCGNWGGYLMLQDRIKSWRQVYPSWRKSPGFEEAFPWSFAKRHCHVKVEYDEPKINWKKVDLVFLCRSGCWSPPEYDERFNRLAQAMGAREGIPIRKIETIKSTPVEMPLLTSPT